MTMTKAISIRVRLPNISSIELAKIQKASLKFLHDRKKNLRFFMAQQYIISIEKKSQ